MHKLTTGLTRRFHTIGVEDLNVRGMMKNRHLACSIADMDFFEFRRQLEYKADMRGARVMAADRFFASSKLCSACAHKLERLPLSVHESTCSACWTTHDRDINAAVNLRACLRFFVIAYNFGMTRKKYASDISRERFAEIEPLLRSV